MFHCGYVSFTCLCFLVSFVKSFFRAFICESIFKHANALVIMHAYILWFIHNTHTHTHTHTNTHTQRQSTWKSNYISSNTETSCTIQSAKMHWDISHFNQLRLQISGQWHIVSFTKKQSLRGLYMRVCVCVCVRACVLCSVCVCVCVFPLHTSNYIQKVQWACYRL